MRISTARSELLVIAMPLFPFVHRHGHRKEDFLLLLRDAAGVGGAAAGSAAFNLSSRDSSSSSRFKLSFTSENPIIGS
jgi:hypothetical protein